jgi:hypothetical protein
MSMFLHIELPKNLRVEGMLGQKNIPCLCRIGGGKGFELAFQNPLPEAIGRVEGWDCALIDERAPAGAGGQYTHYCFGVVTLKRVEANLYSIVDLSFFQEAYPGWFPIVTDGAWSTPAPQKTPEELAEMEAFDASFRTSKLNKKQKKIMDALARNGIHPASSD